MSDPKFYDPLSYWDSLRTHETDASPSVGDGTALVFLAGAIKWWWEPGKWDSPGHREYVAWRNDVRAWLIEAGYLTYAPHEAFKGTWVEAAQAVNDAAILACNLMVVLSPPRALTEGTDAEVLVAKRAHKPVLYRPPFSITKAGFVSGVRYAINQSTQPTPLCGAQDWGGGDEDGSVHIYGTCNLPKDHPTGWHQEKRNGKVWAEWRGPHNARAPQ